LEPWEADIPLLRGGLPRILSDESGNSIAKKIAEPIGHLGGGPNIFF